LVPNVIYQNSYFGNYLTFVGSDTILLVPNVIYQNSYFGNYLNLQ